MNGLVIHAEGNQVRADNIKTQFMSQSIPEVFLLEVVPAIMNPGQPSVGIMRSFKKCIQLAKNNDWPAVCIFEDDVRFLCKYSLKLFISIWSEFYTRCALYSEYETLFLGGLYEGELKEAPSFNNVKQTEGKVSGFHSIIVPKALYDKLLSAEEPYNFDHWCSVEAKIPIYVAYPFLIMQQDGFSYNAHKKDGSGFGADINYTEGLRHKYKFIDDLK